MIKSFTPMNWTGSRALIIATGLLCIASGCMVGPDFKTPKAPLAKEWSAPPTTQVSTETKAQALWWKSFNDPTLDKLIQIAYSQNLSLQVAGLRVLEARAARGIAVGNFFPQQQNINGSYSHNKTSQANPVRGAPPYFDYTTATFDAAWELDVWGKFRRGIESADATLYASVMNYDDALVTLVADVASTYINLRGLDERIAVNHANIVVQTESQRLANVRFKAGGTTELDVQQANAQLTDTQALLPVLLQSRKAAENQLCVLLGIPPGDLDEILGSSAQPMPMPPDSIATGIPADLLRRRPDVRRAEAAAAAQSAQIGVAVADLLPHFQLFGSIGYNAANPGDVFNESSFAYQLGPSFRWDILNYGRIENNIRVQDARFEELLTQYQNTILTAQQDVSNAITSFVRFKEQAGYYSQSFGASKRAVDLSLTQYKAGGTDFTRVLNSIQFLVAEQDNYIVSRINAANSAISLNRALGGGWEFRQDQEFVNPDTIDRMKKRTNWGDVIDNNYSSKHDMIFFKRPTTEPAPDQTNAD